MVLAVVLLVGAAVAGAQQTPTTSLQDDFAAQQSQTDVTVDLPPARGTELVRHVTDANFQLTAHQDTGTTLLPREQDDRYTVTMQGDMVFRNDGYRVNTDARVLERHPAEIQFVVDVASPDGPAAQVMTPRTIQEQVTVDPGTYDATVIVLMDGRAVYREQRQLQLDGVHTQDQPPQEQEQSLQEEERSLQEPFPDGGQTQQDATVEQRIQQLEQRIAVLEQELQRLRQLQEGPETAPEPRQNPQQPSTVSNPTGTQGIQQQPQQDPQQNPRQASQHQGQQPQSPDVIVRRGDTANPVPVATAQNRSDDGTAQQPVRGEEEAALEERGQRQQDRGPVQILISIFT